MAEPDIVEVAVSTPGGEDSYVILVSPHVTASELRARASAAAGCAPLQAILFDPATGELLFLGSSAPLAAVPRELTLVLNDLWASVPEGLHHPLLQVSEDRRRVEHSAWQRNNEACFLSTSLERALVYSLGLRLEWHDPMFAGFFIGVCSDLITDWGDLKGCYFLMRDGTIYDDFFTHTSYGKAAVFNQAAWSLGVTGTRAEVQMVLDARGGGLEMRDAAGSLLARHAEPQLATQESLRFCVSCINPGDVVIIVEAGVG